MGGDRLYQMRRALDAAEEAALAPGACPSRAAVRRRPDPTADTDHRQPFALDGDRILHSLAYTRYIDKTQVFSLVDNENITHRVLHVQMVSKIARGVGRLLGLNQDLIEAIALGHDIGHPPFGHDGEAFLSEKCLEHGLGPFMHNVQSVHFLERVERGGAGLNLSLQVLDGILCHDGEVHTAGLAPAPLAGFEELDRRMEAKGREPKLSLAPMTLEGCVVRICDTVAYVGRDVEDAINLGLIRREDLPAEVTGVLGSSNGTMVYRLVEDLVINSAGREAVGFSSGVGEALRRLKAFNLERIYTNPAIKTQHHKLREGFSRLFDALLEDLRAGNAQSPIFREFLDRMDPAYREGLPPAAQVRDFIAAMTDERFLERYRELLWPSRLSSRFGPLSGPLPTPW